MKSDFLSVIHPQVQHVGTRQAVAVCIRLWLYWPETWHARPRCNCPRPRCRVCLLSRTVNAVLVLSTRVTRLYALFSSCTSTIDVWINASYPFVLLYVIRGLCKLRLERKAATRRQYRRAAHSFRATHRASNADAAE